ncbi:metallophosphoesterase [Ammonicoccus fulvus]|uniref:Metallophosphoesterase n=1 Tax=Ammonicoccus fulvus TaxID=3138240 RepID=A0ABZ3FRI6_9ACTN
MKLKLGVLAAATTLALSGLAAPAQAANPNSDLTFAVIGDVPYGAAQFVQFPHMVDEINAQDKLRFVAHVGDIKAGSQRCDDSYFLAIREQFDRFEDPFLYTPGDNEWVDCHRANNGAYNPLERLDKLREVFYPVPGRTLGGTMPLKSQAALGLPENVSFREARVEFAVLNVQGSNNDLAPWTGIGKTSPTPEQLAEFNHRQDANLALLNETFDRAEQRNARGVVIMLQADMFDPWLLAQDPTQNDVSGFVKLVEALSERSSAFDGPVYLINGDSHRYNADKPLAADSEWLRIYGVEAAPNLQRITVEGDANSHEWTRFTVNKKGDEVLTWERVPYTF